jgi:Coenzyme PQQ synthesis protein D (PqqD)
LRSRKAQADDPLAAVNLLALAPRRAAEWEEAGDRAVVLRPPPGGRGWRRLGEWLSFQLSTRRIRLDEIASFVWKRLDGQTAVGQIAAEARATYGERVEPAEERVGQFVRLLRRERLVSYPGFDR